MFKDMVFKDWVTILASIVGAITIPFTLVGIWRNRVITQQSEYWRDRQKEIDTYNDLNTKYYEFLKLLHANSDINIGEIDTPTRIVDPKDKYKRDLMYAMFVTMIERAYVLYREIDKHERSSKEAERGRSGFAKLVEKVESNLFGSPQQRIETHIFQNQWPGWKNYIEYYCGHVEFQIYWRHQVPNEKSENPTLWQDQDFEKFISGIISTKETEALKARIAQENFKNLVKIVDKHNKN